MKTNIRRLNIIPMMTRLQVCWERGYAKDHVWLGKKHLSEFGKSEEEIIHNVIVEIVTLFDLLDHSASF